MHQGARNRIDGDVTPAFGHFFSCVLLLRRSGILPVALCLTKIWFVLGHFEGKKSSVLLTTQAEVD